MSKSVLQPLAAALVLGLAPALPAQTPPPAKPLTETELLRTLDGLGKGDPITKQPLSAPAEPALPTRDEPTGAKGAEGKKGAETADAPAKQTEITSEEGTFDSKTHQAVFTIKVFVKNPDFTVSCDKMTAWMKHDDTKTDKKAGGKATPAATPKGVPPRATPGLDAQGVKITPAAGSKKTEGADSTAGGLDKALAEGNVIITQDKVDDDGKVTHNVGRGKSALYESATGNITLKGKPEVQQGINSCVSLDEGTIIIMNRDGHFHSIGPTKNIIREASSTPSPKSTSANGR